MPEALLSSIQRAIDHPDFEASDLRFYWKLAFEQDDPLAQSALLKVWPLVEPIPFDQLVKQAFFSQKVRLLGLLSEMSPSTFSAPREDGIDLGRSSLLMAIARQQPEAAESLASLLLARDPSGRGLVSTLAEGLALVELDSTAHWTYVDAQELADRQQRSRQICSAIERSYLSHGIASGSVKPSRSLSL